MPGEIPPAFVDVEHNCKCRHQETDEDRGNRLTTLSAEPYHSRRKLGLVEQRFADLGSAPNRAPSIVHKKPPRAPPIKGAK